MDDVDPLSSRHERMKSLAAPLSFGRPCPLMYEAVDARYLGLLLVEGGNPDGKRLAPVLRELANECWSTGPRMNDARKAVDIAVLVPCYNEESTIKSVVDAFRASVPSARIYVYDNNSTDGTAAVAGAAGAIVKRESRQGKGNVVRRMFGDIDAEVFVMVDGDGTYDASAAGQLIEHLVDNDLDLVNAARVEASESAYRSGHRFGNWLLTGLVKALFGRQFHDMLSGYKVMSRRFVKSFPAMSSGFETETELAVHALELRMPCAEIATNYKERPSGSVSKLRTYRDGTRILLLIFRLVKDERPLQFFSLVSVLFVTVAMILIIPILLTFFETGLVPRLPTAVLSLGLVIIGVLSLFAGLILEMTTKTRQELKRLHYLSVSKEPDAHRN